MPDELVARQILLIVDPERPRRQHRPVDGQDDDCSCGRQKERIIDLVGPGQCFCMASIFLAQAAEGGAPQVLKVMQLGKAVEADGLQRFIQEYALLAQIEHPNVARLLDGGTTEGGLPYLVMEYLRGHDLGHVPSHGNAAGSGDQGDASVPDQGLAPRQHPERRGREERHWLGERGPRVFQ